jgi:predicted transcriptional regulator
MIPLFKIKKMKRKNFLTTALLALPALSFAHKSDVNQKKPSVGNAAKKGFIVKTTESRFNGRQTTPKEAFWVMLKI